MGKVFPFLRLSTKFLAVLRLSVNPHWDPPTSCVAERRKRLEVIVWNSGYGRLPRRSKNKNKCKAGNTAEGYLRPKFRLKNYPFALQSYTTQESTIVLLIYFSDVLREPGEGGFQPGGGGCGGLPYKSHRDARRKIKMKPLRENRGCGSNWPIQN